MQCKQKALFLINKRNILTDDKIENLRFLSYAPEHKNRSESPKKCRKGHVKHPILNRHDAKDAKKAVQIVRIGVKALD